MIPTGVIGRGRDGREGCEYKVWYMSKLKTSLEQGGIQTHFSEGDIQRNPLGKNSGWYERMENQR